jgi:hypothetical protein
MKDGTRRPCKGKIDRMTIIDPGEVPTVDEAARVLKREIASGAVGFGEHYGEMLMFDDPKNLMLYEACEKIRVSGLQCGFQVHSGAGIHLAFRRLCMAKQGMTTQEEAVEQLRVIRSVMERATIFRALSGETALIGGAAALAAAWLSEGRHVWAWAVWWLVGLVLVIAFNVFQIFRVKLAFERPFWSPGLRVALRGVMPSLIAGGFLGLIFVRVDQDRAAACMWILHYGLALLAIREFAP